MLLHSLFDVLCVCECPKDVIFARFHMNGARQVTIPSVFHFCAPLNGEHTMTKCGNLGENTKKGKIFSSFHHSFVVRNCRHPFYAYEIQRFFFIFFCPVDYLNVSKKMHHQLWGISSVLCIQCILKRQHYKNI